MHARRDTIWILFLALSVASASAADPAKKKVESKREDFTVAEHKAFIILPETAPKDRPIRWVWYAPTFHKSLPGGAEKWMFNHFFEEGIAIAGVDVSESYGSQKGRAVYQALYEELTTKRSFHRQPVLLARSRGGLMLYNWAVEHPDSVAGIAGIYPVCNVASYPGLNRAAGAYEMTPDQLNEKLTEHNPIDRLAPLAKAKVPIFHIHGDVDKVVPLEANSGEVARRYKELGGKMELVVPKGQGHNLWEGFFTCRELVDFVLTRCETEKGK